MWFTEDAWTPMILIGGVGILMAFLAIAQQKMKLMVVAAVLLASCGAIYAIEQSIVTDAEMIEADIYEMAADFQRNDLTAFLSHFSVQNKGLQAMAVGALEMVDIDNDYRVTDMQIETKAENTLADSHFRVNVTADVKLYGNVGRRPTRWKVDWRKEAGVWKIIEVTRLSVVGNEEMGILEARE